MKNIFYFFNVMFLFIPVTAIAGTISGGGGRLVKYSQNPWFLENTKVVTYCITKHRDFPNISLSRLDEIVKEGISKWKEAFDYTIDEYYEDGELEPYGEIRIATQQFVNNCDAPDLRFEFGGMTDADLKEFPSYKDYVGAAVLTNYNLETLKGTGFIYISSLQGAFSPDSDLADPRAWDVADNFLLRTVLWHELGHIFGVPHDLIGTTGPQSVMHERLPENHINSYMVEGISQGESIKILERTLTPLGLFKPTLSNNQIHCGENSPFINQTESKRFGTSLTAKCTMMLIERIETGTDIKERVEFYESDIGPNGPWEKFAYLKKDNTSGRRNQEMQTRVFVPKSQKVFTKLPGSYESTGVFPLFGEVKTVSESYHGIYTPLHGGKKMGMKVQATIGEIIKITTTDENLEIREYELWQY